jgi:hypothetical protein
MPEVFRHGSFVVRVLLPPREHGPAHVHVRCPDGIVIVGLDPAVELREIHGDVKQATVREILEAIAERQDECIAAWRKYHG